MMLQRNGVPLFAGTLILLSTCFAWEGLSELTFPENSQVRPFPITRRNYTLVDDPVRQELMDGQGPPLQPPPPAIYPLTPQKRIQDLKGDVVEFHENNPFLPTV
ncbi:uncharacterized protein LOC129592229 isoform X2 [Paramacrobiotus metropolitanus]|uniref:uncharacterized protein LOC129592229 isoform X2 n=1 Tax=Paramacrobiotus metropolitanus TaxID=2943436 RepID=UPI002445738B|nr:uncharacterized protein LOC129592229 isoform X2 [Paramacrobiotus metropolitanus]